MIRSTREARVKPRTLMPMPMPKQEKKTNNSWMIDRQLRKRKRIVMRGDWIERKRIEGTISRGRQQCYSRR